MTIQSRSKSTLLRRSILMILVGFLVLSAIFFLPAGTLHYWQAWVYLAILFIPMAAVMLYLIQNDPALLERRLQIKERRAEQQKIISFSYPLFLLTFLLPGFDRRFGWSNLSAGVVIAADLIVLLSYGFFFLVLRENSYASRIIEVQPDQQVISSGPYTIIRHPMYSGILLLYIFSPLALGSRIAMTPACLLIPIIILRIIEEEKTLIRDLKGYREYMQKIRYRLIPGIW